MVSLVMLLVILEGQNPEWPRKVHPQDKIIVPAIYILANVAGSIPRHRQLMIAQTELLKMVVNRLTARTRKCGPPSAA
jgi:hypothetical protein